MQGSKANITESKAPNSERSDVASTGPDCKSTPIPSRYTLLAWQKHVRAIGMYVLIFWATVVMISEMLKHFNYRQFSDETFASMHKTLVVLVVGYIAMRSVIQVECASRLSTQSTRCSTFRHFMFGVASVSVMLSTLASLVYVWGRFEWAELYAVYEANRTLFGWSFFIVAVVWFASPSASED